MRITAHPATVTGTSSSAVSSIDRLAPLVTDDTVSAGAIKVEVTRLDRHDLTALRNGVVPEHVPIPQNDRLLVLARSYAEAELVDRDRKASWWKSWIGWGVMVVVALVSALVGWLLKSGPQ